jgi:glutathione S-transferase
MMMEELTFYSSWYCPFAQRAWAVLEHLGIPYVYEETDPYDKSESWLKLSRGTGQVPVLKYRNYEGAETRIPDSLRTMEFLYEMQHSTKVFFPASVTAKAEARFWLDQQGRTIIPYFYQFLKAESNSQNLEDAKNKMIVGLDEFTQGMSNTEPFFFSDQPGIVDFAFAPFALRIEILLSHYKGFQLSDSGEFAHRYTTWWNAMKSVPAFVRTMPQRDTYETRLLKFYLPYSIGGGQEDVTQVA